MRLTHYFLTVLSLWFFNLNAATITVTNINDSGTGSLRAAVTAANTGDVVVFDSSLIASGNATIVLNSEITIAAAITITGLITNTDTLFISGNNTTRIFGISIPSVTFSTRTILNRLALINGSATGAYGGAVACGSGHLDVNYCIFKNNSAQNGGAITMASGNGTYFFDLTINYSSLYNNNATTNGGAVYILDGANANDRSRVYINFSSLYENTAFLGASAVGAYSNNSSANFPGNVTTYIYLKQCTIYDNSCSSTSGGAIHASSSYSNNSTSTANAYVYIENSTIMNNAPYGVVCQGTNNSYIYSKSSIFAFNTIRRGALNNNLTSQGNNIFTVSSIAGGQSSDQLGATATTLNLTPIGLNGGSTKTLMPMTPSIAIDAGSTSIVDAQNGPIIGIRDAGAAEALISHVTDVVFSCSPYTWIDGITYYSSNNTAKDTLVSSLGYDSIVSLNLTINQPTTAVINYAACESYTFNSSTYTSSGTYTHVLMNNAGCDSTITLNLTINQPTSASVNVTECGSYTWPVNNQTYATSGAYTHVIPNANNCDSTITLNLTINQPTGSSVNVTECESYTWPVNNQTYTNSGAYTHIIPNTNNCDSTITLNLTIHQPTSASVAMTACESYTWPVNNQAYTTSGAYTHIIPNTNNCDSTITLNLTIHQPTNASVAMTACESYTWPINNQTYTTSGTYTHIIPNTNNCDSTITLNLMINQPTSSSVAVTECESYTWPLNNQTYTTSGTYTHSIPNANNCDSTIILNLTIHQPTSASVNVTACEVYHWPVNNQTYTASGVYTYVTSNSNTCDSTISLNLTINNVNTAVSMSGNTLTAAQSGATYQWVDCSNDTPVSGATSQSFTPAQNGSYSVELNVNGCTTTSNCMNVTSVGIETIETVQWTIAPNPGSGMYTITTSQHLQHLPVEVLTVSGQVVYSGIYSGYQQIINLENQPNGVYLLKADQQVFRIVKI